MSCAQTCTGASHTTSPRHHRTFKKKYSHGHASDISHSKIGYSTGVAANPTHRQRLWNLSSTTEVNLVPLDVRVCYITSNRSSYEDSHPQSAPKCHIDYFILIIIYMFRWSQPIQLIRLQNQHVNIENNTKIHLYFPLSPYRR